MAFASVGTLGSNQSKTANQASIVLTTSAVAEVGNLVVVVVAKDNSNGTDADHSEISSVTDSAGNTYTKAREYTNGQGGAQSGCTVSVWYSVIATQLGSGGTITANFPDTTPNDATAISAWEFTKGASTTIQIAAGAGLADDGADPGSMSLSSLTSREYLFVRGFAAESNSATLFGNQGGYSGAFDATQTSGGGAAANMAVRGLFHITTTTSTTNDPTAFNADWASVLIALYEAADAIAKSGSDTLSVSLTESSAITAGLTASDTPTVGVTEGTPTILASLDRSDTVSVGVTEGTPNLLGFLSRADDLTVSLGEAVAVMVLFAVSDTVSCGISEGAPAISVVLAVSDTLSVATSEGTPTLLGFLDRSDDLTVSLGESVGLLGFLERVDTLSVTLADAAALLGLAAVSDTLSVAIQEGTPEISVVLAVSDTLSVAITDASQAPQVFLDRSDTLSVALTEAAVLLALLERSDALSVAVSEGTPDLLGLVSVSDVLNISAGETLSLLVQVGAVDQLTVALVEAAVVAQPSGAKAVTFTSLTSTPKVALISVAATPKVGLTSVTSTAKVGFTSFGRKES